MSVERQHVVNPARIPCKWRMLRCFVSFDTGILLHTRALLTPYNRWLVSRTVLTVL
jgi:hypothetical protein